MTNNKTKITYTKRAVKWFSFSGSQSYLQTVELGIEEEINAGSVIEIKNAYNRISGIVNSQLEKEEGWDWKFR